ncbi:Peroxidase 18 [Acorus calamus]|uniref:Peroxidase n=1 Tax=Acorus calamus TaxID=4465 RepID=A0AAV9FCT0_ACOCL|nr:Peroxidase 18 [Acorus calamus]
MAFPVSTMDYQTHHHSLTILFSSLLLLQASFSSSQLSFGFYANSCPNAELLVKDTVRSATESQPALPGKVLRLLFLDCLVEGCDGSVLIEGNGTERSDPANQSLGGFSLIDSAKQLVEIFCPGIVSCADVLALAARDAVELAGGPSVQIPTGRRDGRVSLASSVRPNILDTSFTIDEMLQIFSSKGLSTDDLIALSGAHTIGTAHCSAFSDRFQEDPEGKLTPIDNSMDGNYTAELIKQCPASASPSITVNNDPATANLFDNQYYQNLLANKGLFQSDSALVRDQRTRQRVETFANDQEEFFKSWAASFVKLTSIDVKTAQEGEIRMSCMNIN